MLYLVLILGGVIIGLVFGRWWALGAAAVAGIWIALVSEVDEVPGWYLGGAYAVLSALGIASGILVRKRLARG